MGLTAPALQAEPAQRAAGCAHATDDPSEATAKQIRAALACLLGRERRKADRLRLREHGALGSVATRHTKLMLRKDCFEHRCRGERTLEKRILASGYVRPGDSYRFAENIGCARTPKAQVQAWMHSREPRKNIRRARFTHIGIGFRKGAPESVDDCAPEFGTYTVTFAWRKG